MSAAQSVFFGTFNNDVLAFNLKTRNPLWRFENPARQFPFYSSAAILNEKVILGGRAKIGHCLHGQTGKALWTFATRSRGESSPPIVAGGVDGGLTARPF